MDNWLNTLAQCLGTHSVQNAPNFSWDFLSPSLHAWLCIGSLKKFNQRYPIKNDATLLICDGAGIAKSPMSHEAWGLGVTIALPRRVLGGHRYRWDLSEIHASQMSHESSTSSRSENSDSLSGVIPF